MLAAMGGGLAGRVCVVTGATSGIGEQTALGLARLGARVVLIGRSRERGERARAAVAAEARDGRADLLLADLSVQAELRRLAAELLARYPAIHVLLNNAGVAQLRRTTTRDGIETTFAVNHLAYFLLTDLLRERLVASAPARVVNVASEAHRFGEIDFDDLGYERRRYRWMRVYGSSKLANLLFSYELARRLEGTGVTANCLHPGAVATRLGQQNGRFAVVLTRLLRPFFLSPARGAETSIHLAAAAELAETSGRYFARSRERRSSDASYDEAAARRLWEVSAAMTAQATA